MIKLSVNINKIASIRNARGGNVPDVSKAALDIERFGADGITVHPRPDERHIRYSDVYEIKPLLKTEFNIEGNPTEQFKKMVLDVKPHQVTLVPDAPDAITSNAGWDTKKHKTFLQDIISEFKNAGIRTSIFVDPDPELAMHAALCGTDRVELYTESYAVDFLDNNKEEGIKPFVYTAQAAVENGLGLNAGHDLNLENLNFFAQNIPGLMEVSIGHALISDALYYGLENVVPMYKRLLK